MTPNCLLLLMAIIAADHLNAQPGSPDPFRPSHAVSVSSTFLTGADVLFPRLDNGMLSVILPYSETDSAGNTTSHTFSGQNNKAYFPRRVFIFPAALGLSFDHHFLNCSTFLGIVDGNEALSLTLSLGYGYNFYWFPTNSGYSHSAKRYFTITPALNLVYNSGKSAHTALLGTIDNFASTVHVLGSNVGPTFIGYLRNGATTYAAKNLNLYYGQDELSLLPRVILASSSFKYSLVWELSIGYNIALLDKGAINMQQDDGNGHSNDTGNTVSLKNNNIDLAFNNRKASEAPCHFSGLYLSFGMAIGRR
jgi:hypothetical protein